MIRKDGSNGFGEVFKVYGDALDLISQNQKELSAWKGETTELMKPLNEVDLVKLSNTVITLSNDLRSISNTCNQIMIDNKEIQKDYLAIKKDYILLKEENEQLKNDLKHIQGLTDVISFTCSKECAKLKNKAKKKILVMLGGNTSDERYKLFYKKYIMNLYDYIKKNLEVSSIDRIPTNKLSEAEALLGKWIPTPAFKKKLITELVKDTTPTKDGAYKVKIETVVQFNSLMDKFNGEPEKYM